MSMKNFFRCFRVSYLKRQVEELGGEITLKNILILVFCLFMGAFISDYLLMLEPVCVLILAFFFICCIPSLILAKFKSNYQKVRFNDIVDYIEQLIYAFHKNGKIRASLDDARQVTSETMQKIITKMLYIIDFDKTTVHIYEKAFQLMQDEYNCSRVKTLHSYLLRCESNGGDNIRSLNMLLDDTRDWADRTIEYQNQRNNTKRDVLVSIGLAMFTCGVMINLIPQEYSSQIVSDPLYQIATTIILCCCILIYTVVCNLLAKSYLDYEIEDGREKRAMVYMDYLTARHRNRVKPLIIKLSILVILMGVCVYFSKPIGVVPLCIIAIFVASQDLIKRNTAIKIVTKELNKAFPVWMRTLILYLQTDNVHVAIEKSKTDCPNIMKHELDLFTQDLANDPVTLKPYNNFLGSFNIPTIKTSINYLYSVACFGTEDMLTQLDYLVRQNNLLAINEEKLRNEDALAGVNVFIFFPMILACFKFIVDLVLFLNIFMNMLQAYV
jgi:hypothetical protein